MLQLTNETPRLQDYLSSVPVAGSFNPVLHYVIVNKDPDIRAALTSDRGALLEVTDMIGLQSSVWCVHTLQVVI